MSHFLQLHLLTHYPPSNLNRDDLNRPKTAFMGGELRLRVSSQSLKRAWRTSEVFQEAFAGQMGTRTRDFRKLVFEPLVDKGVPPAEAAEWTDQFMAVYRKASETKQRKKKTAQKKELDLDDSRRFVFDHLVFLGPTEMEAIAGLVERIAAGEEPGPDELRQALRKEDSAVDLAMFGRMLADQPSYNIEAAVQVAHAVTVNRVVVEDDFFTAMDDLNPGVEDVGAGHMDEIEFGSGTFYLYLCCDCRLLIENLGGNKDLAGRALGALAEAAATVGPTGKQNSFASRALANYVLAERGDRQPRSLAWSFVPAIKDSDQVRAAIAALRETRDRMDKVYGALAEARVEMDAAAGEGSLEEVVRFCREACA